MSGTAMDPIVARSREIIDQGSKSFGMAARLFAPETRDSAFMLYAWCRYCDDVIDGQTLGMNAQNLTADEAASRLAMLKARTAAALKGHPDGPEFIALARVAERHEIPPQFPLDLLQGFEMDVGGHTYRTDDDLYTYCYHVAGVVGVMMAYVMGVNDLPTLRRANDLGIAFQLTNIARDIVPDTEQSRLYLPADWLTAEGLDPSPEAVGAPDNREALARVAGRLVTDADRYYDSARKGLPALTWRCAWAIATARTVYREIGHQVRKAGPKAWDHRISVSKGRKLAFAATGFLTAMASRLWPRDRRAQTRTDLWTPSALADKVRNQER